MKYFLTLLIALTFAINSYAAKAGVGVFVQKDGGGISVPIDISDSFRIEPTFEYARFEENNLYGVPSNPEFITTEVGLGVGLFGQRKIDKAVNFYYGARLNYSYYSFERTNPSPSATDERHGYKAVPTLGLEYFLTDALSLGAEAGWYFEYLDSVDFGHATDTGIDARFVARYFF